MDAPIGRENSVDILGREKVGRAMRAVEHPDGPVGAELRLLDRAGAGNDGRRMRRKMQRIADAKPAPAMPAELTKIESAAASEIGWNVQSAGEQYIAAHSAAADAAERKHLAFANCYRPIARYRLAVERCVEVRPGQTDTARRVELERRAGGGCLKTRGISIVADSAQFSASIAELADRSRVGTMLTLQTALGFLLTLVTIHLMPHFVAWMGWRYAFVPLSIGPAIGVWAMARLRARPEASRLANGRG